MEEDIEENSVREAVEMFEFGLAPTPPDPFCSKRRLKQHQVDHEKWLATVNRFFQLSLVGVRPCNCAALDDWFLPAHFLRSAPRSWDVPNTNAVYKTPSCIASISVA